MMKDSESLPCLWNNMKILQKERGKIWVLEKLKGFELL